MSNGTICCALEVCCPPPPSPGGENEKRIEALAKYLADALGWSAEKTATTKGNARGAAELILERFDLVPKGVGRAIVDAYRPEFEKAFRKGGAGEARPNAGPEGA